ncbi:MAG: PKD domain-containing protein [Oryzihumus sp.]
MTSHTQRFGLNRFGGNAGGAIGDEGSKFSLHDPQVVDSLLAALEHHDHRGTGVALSAPATGPLTSIGGSGSLPGGTKVYYRTSYLDAYGLETAASPEVGVVMPSPVTAPTAPTLSVDGTSGGLQVGGGYLYALSTVVSTDAQNPTGSVLGQTEVSSAASATVEPGQTVTATLPALPGVVTSITNQVTNPSAEIDLSGWTWNPANCLLERATDSPNMLGTACFRLTHLNGNTDLEVGVTTGPFTVPENTLCTFSLYLQQLSGVSGLELVLYSAGQMTIVPISPDSQYTRYSASLTTGPGETWVTGMLRFTTAGTGDKVIFDAVQLEQGPLSPYADGSLGVGYAWTGTPYLSTSTRAAAVGTVGYYIYRQAPGEQGMFLLTSGGTPVFLTSGTFVDDGSYTPDPAKLAPYSNSTSATNSVLCTVGTLPPEATAWRLYRTFASGDYPTQSLVHEVTEGTPGTTNLMVNPEAATDLTGWGSHDTVSGSALVRQTDQLPPVGNGASVHFTRLAGTRTVSNVYAAVQDGKIESGQTYALTVYAQWDGTGTNPTVNLQVGASDGTGLVAPTSPDLALNSIFTRITYVFTATADLAPGGVAMLLLDETTNATGVRLTGWQLEQEVPTAYVADTRLPVLATQYLDLGGPLLDGTPLSQSETFGAPGPVQLPVYTVGTRPPAFELGEGAAYWDSGLGRPIWSNGTAYVDVIGTGGGGGGGTVLPNNIVHATSDYTMGANDALVEANASTAPITVHLPSASAAIYGASYTVKRMNAGANQVNVVAQSPQLIDGVANYPLSAQWQALTLMSDGTQWLVRTTANVQRPPVASFTPLMTDRTLSVTNTSYSPSGDAITFAWQFGDGSTSVATTPVHGYTTDGQYNVTLTVTDARGLTGTVTQTVTATPPADYRRPYATTALPNKTIGQKYPGGVPVLPQAYADIITGSVDSPNSAPSMYWGSDVTQYTMPIYIRHANTPTAGLAWTGTFTESSDTSTTATAGAGTVTLQIPDGIKPAVGSDSQVIIWDPLTGDEYGFYACVKDSSGYWAKDSNGRYQCQNWYHFSGEKTSLGSPASAPSAFGSRGAGIMYFYGLIRPWEIAQGHIDHEIAVAWSTPASTYAYPATKSDGTQSPADQLPEGALLKLRDSFPLQDIADPTARMIATAMQQYGVRCIDHAAHPKIYLESDQSVGLGTNWGNQLATNLLREIPITDFVPVDPNGSSTLRETDLRWDPTVAADPLSTLPAVLETAVGIGADPTVPVQVVDTNSWTPNPGELLLCFVTMKAPNAEFVTGVTGNGVTWRRLSRRMEPSNTSPSVGYSQNLVQEVWAARADTAFTGPVQANISLASAGALSVVVEAHRITAGAAIGRRFTKDFACVPLGTAVTTSALPSVPLRGTSHNSLVLGQLTTRGVNAGAGNCTAVTLNTTAGSSGTVVKQSTLSIVGGGDVVLTPTLSGATEWLFTAVEVT